MAVRISTKALPACVVDYGNITEVAHKVTVVNLPNQNQRKTSSSGSLLCFQYSMKNSSHENVYRIADPLWGESTDKPMDSPPKGPVKRSFGDFDDDDFIKLLNKQSSCRWVDAPWRPRDVTQMRA